MMKKKCVALLLVFALCLSLMPAAFAVLDTGHSVAVTFKVLYVDSEFYIGYNYGASESTTFVCQYAVAHSDTAYSNHTIAESDIKAAASRLSLSAGYEFKGWTKSASANPTINSFKTYGSTTCNKGDTIFLVAKRSEPLSKTYTLSYNANGGTNAPAAQSASTTTGSATFTIHSQKPINGDKVFLGWSKDKNTETATYQPGGNITISTDTMLYAVWTDPQPQTYTLTVVTDPAGGTTSGSGNYASGASASISASAPAAPVQKVYVFDGWTSSNGGSFANVNAESTTFTMPSGAVTVTANYTLKDDTNGNGEPDDEETKYDILYVKGTTDEVTGMPSGETDVLPGVEKTVSTARPEREGYVFAGWTTSDVNVADGKFTMPEKDVTFTATWERAGEETNDIRYEPGTRDTVRNMPANVYDVQEGTTQTRSSRIPVRAGWIFDGWKTDDVVVDKNGRFTMPGKDVTFTATWERDENNNGIPDSQEKRYDIYYETGSRDKVTNMPSDEYNVLPGLEKAVSRLEPKRAGYVFTGWETDDVRVDAYGRFIMPRYDVTFTASWAVDRNGDGKPDASEYYTLIYESNGGTEYANERYEGGTYVALKKTPVRTGYEFTGWHADRMLTRKINGVWMNSDITVYAGWKRVTTPADKVPEWLNGDDHDAYVVGYTDGTVRPENNITRAEVATIFFRLLDEDVRDRYLTRSNSFTDVDADAWYNTPVSTMTAMGILSGRTAATFDPDAPITRAEFAAICARFDEGPLTSGVNFSDISGHWAEYEIKRAASLGWISGYINGTFAPNQSITRAEAMSIINRVLQRLPESEDDLLPGMKTWTDNANTRAWYYLAVQEATNSHDFVYKDATYETWTALTRNPDWTQY